MSAAKHSVFRAVKKLRVALEPLRGQVSRRTISAKTSSCSTTTARAPMPRHRATPRARARPARRTYREIAGTLGMIAVPEVPARGDQYGLEVWQRIRTRCPNGSPRLVHADELLRSRPTVARGGRRVAGPGGVHRGRGRPRLPGGGARRRHAGGGVDSRLRARRHHDGRATSGSGCSSSRLPTTSINRIGSSPTS